MRLAELLSKGSFRLAGHGAMQRWHPLPAAALGHLALHEDSTGFELYSSLNTELVAEHASTKQQWQEHPSHP